MTLDLPARSRIESSSAGGSGWAKILFERAQNDWQDALAWGKDDQYALSRDNNCDTNSRRTQEETEEIRKFNKYLDNESLQKTYIMQFANARDNGFQGANVLYRQLGDWGGPNYTIMGVNGPGGQPQTISVWATQQVDPPYTQFWSRMQSIFENDLGNGPAPGLGYRSLGRALADMGPGGYYDRRRNFFGAVAPMSPPFRLVEMPTSVGDPWGSGTSVESILKMRGIRSEINWWQLAYDYGIPIVATALYLVPGGFLVGSALNAAHGLDRTLWFAEKGQTKEAWVNGAFTVANLVLDIGIFSLASKATAPASGARAGGGLGGAAADSRSVWSSAAGDVVVAGDSLPGRAGVEVSRRLTTAEMQALQQSHRVEFALIYELGPGRGGGGGRYLLFSGTHDRVWFPPNGNYIWISHSHPEGYLLQASKDDRLWLGLMQRNGSPQTTSVIAPVDGVPFRFSPTRNRLPDDFMRNR